MESNYCPYCQKTVEYEFSDGDYFCSICARNKKTAEEDVKYIEKRKFIKKSKLIFKIIGFSLLSLFILFSWVIAPDRMAASAKRWPAYAAICGFIALIGVIFEVFKIIIKRAKDKKT